MEVKSKFRKLFWIRIIIGFIVFITIVFAIIFYLYLNTPLRVKVLSKNPFLITALLFLTFLIYVGTDLFKIFKITVSDKGIEKTLIISGRKEIILFKEVKSVKNKKIRMRTKSGNLTDGYTITVLKLEKNRSLILSPDYFENYKDILIAVKNNLE